jgi:hypothetical protein
MLKSSKPNKMPEDKRIKTEGEEEPTRPKKSDPLDHYLNL